MKKIFYIIIFISLLGSCTENALDKKPLDLLSDEDVWKDPILIDAFVTNLYINLDLLENETPYQDWASSVDWNGPFIINELSDESMSNWIRGQSQHKVWGINISGGIMEWWERGYSLIRSANILINRLPDADVDESFKKSKIAEVRFLRAFNYFSMVKRYGGVPLITVVQDPKAPLEELQVKRNSEQELYDFIIKEMNSISSDLPEKAEIGRPSKYAALALQSRAALYAGSIAKYGVLQLDGLLGIPQNEAAKYFSLSYEASNEIIKGGSYKLYEGDFPDRIKNFKNVFLKKMADGNPESIWVKAHNETMRNNGGVGWVWDFFQCPKPHAWNAGNQNAPYLEMAESYEYIDGTSGRINPSVLNSKLWTMPELWQDKDPRFFATIYTQGTPWKGSKVDFHNGLIKPGGGVIISGEYEGIPASGNQSTDRSFGTGFGVMKYLDENHDNSGERSSSSTDFILFRYAEILLNHAEAAFEISRPDEALSAVNQVRNRAGIAPLTVVTLPRIRNERKVELAFEGHRYWDLRRWRIAENELTINRRGLRYVLDYEGYIADPNNPKYKVMILGNIDGNANPVFYNYNYYLPITLARTRNNPNLVENPGYQ